MESELAIGEVAQRSGLTTPTLRFYEDQGLIQSRRNDGGHRRYPRAVLRRLAFIVFAQRIGMTLENIAAELRKLPTNAVPKPADWAKLSGEWKRRIDEKIAELERLRDGVTQCIGCGCLSLPQCRLSNPGDRAKEYGPGPLMWTTGRPRRKRRSGAAQRT